MVPAPQIVVTATVALAVVLLAPLLTRRLPEPDDPEAPGYATLVDLRFRLLLVASTVVAAAVVVLAVPPGLQPLWWPVLGLGVWCAVIDGLTTWLPRQLCWAGWALAGLSTVVVALTGSIRVAAVAAGVALAGTALVWLVWRFAGGGLGFGDVRVMPLLGLAGGSLGISGAWWSLLVGSLMGLAWGVLRRLRGRPGSFPYGPSLVAGPFVVALLRLV